MVSCASCPAHCRHRYQIVDGPYAGVGGEGPEYASIGSMGSKLGNADLEIEAYKKAIRIAPDYASAHYNLGMALLQTGDKAAALDEYKILKALDKQSANQLFNQIYY